MSTLEAREVTAKYGMGFARLAESAARRRTEAIGERATSCGAVRLWIERMESTPIEVPLPPGAEVVLGSADDAGVVLEDPTVSARHCRLTHAGAFVEVTDLGATNGVRVGGVRVPRAALPLGSACEVGRTTVRVLAPTTPAVERGAPLPGLVGRSGPMRVLAASVRRVARLRLPALLRGDSGTGKDLVARAVHDESARAGRPFVALNAAAITRELAESELFGHQRGAFTGAVKDRRGAFREAHGGTLFLDEIGAVPLEVQAKLLRVVEEGVVRPVGGEAAVPVDVRLVAATCEPIEQRVAEGRFRADLYERLAVCVIQVPPLCDRLDDIPLLARHLLETCAELGGVAIAEEAMAALRAYAWPGNVRELRNVLVQAAILAPGAIQAEHVAAILADRAPRGRPAPTPDVMRVFQEAHGNISETARRLGLARSTCKDRLREAGVPPWPRSRAK